MPPRMRRPGPATSPATSAAGLSSRRRTTRCWARSALAARPAGWSRATACWLRAGATRARSARPSASAKSYLSLLAGIAVADGLIPDIDRPVRESVDDGGFDTAQNATDHLAAPADQHLGMGRGRCSARPMRSTAAATSASEGQGKKGQRALAARRHALGIQRHPGEPPVARAAAPLPAARCPMCSREAVLRADRRLGRVALGRLPHVVGDAGGWAARAVGPGRHALGRRCLDPCRGPGARRPAGAEPRRLGGPPGSCRPHGSRNRSQPCALNPHYGFLWWLNTDGTRFPSAARDAFFASGAGGNLTWVDPSSGIVAVLRWTDPAAMDGFIGRVRAALKG